MCWQSERRIPASARAPAVGRAFVTDVLPPLIGADPMACDDAELITSELVTNAVNAGADSVLISLELHRIGLRIAVCGDGQGVPALGRPTSTDTAGRGLVLVSTLAENWGVQVDSAPSTCVWAQVALTPAATFDLECDGRRFA